MGVQEMSRCWPRRNRILFKEKERAQREGRAFPPDILPRLSTVRAQTRKVSMTQLVANALIGYPS